MNLNFESVAQQTGTQILQITKDDFVIAKGVYIPEAVACFCDNNISVLGYPDTGVFILFKGSHASSLEDKYKPYIDSDKKTNRELIFQSKNAAAQFVLGAKGNTNYWKCQE